MVGRNWLICLDELHMIASFLMVENQYSRERNEVPVFRSVVKQRARLPKVSGLGGKSQAKFSCRKFGSHRLFVSFLAFRPDTLYHTSARRARIIFKILQLIFARHRHGWPAVASLVSYYS